jgi:hypothetical protein
MGRADGLSATEAILSVWRVETHGAGGFFRQAVIPIAVDATGRRVPTGEGLLNSLREIQPATEGVLDQERRRQLIDAVLPEMLRRDVEHRGLLLEGGSLSTQLIAWIELC